jgi:hypothetical protein
MTIEQDSHVKDDAESKEYVNEINNMSIHIQSSVMRKWIKEIDFE